MAVSAATTPSVHDRWRQEFEIADRKLAVFFDENDLEIEVWIKVLALFQFFYGDSLCRGHLLKFLRGQFGVDLPAQTRSPDVGGNPVGHRADGKHGVHRAELFLATPVQNVGI